MVPVAKVPTAVAPHPPTESEMAAVLGDAYPAFQALVGRAGAGAAEWQRYTKNSPWVLKAVGSCEGSRKCSRDTRRGLAT
jgi:hypothetical protein